MDLLQLKGERGTSIEAAFLPLCPFPLTPISITWELWSTFRPFSDSQSRAPARFFKQSFIVN